MGEYYLRTIDEFMNWWVVAERVAESSIFQSDQLEWQAFGAESISAATNSALCLMAYEALPSAFGIKIEGLKEIVVSSNRIVDTSLYGVVLKDEF